MIARIILWGTGIVYNTHINLIKTLEENGRIEIVAVTDSFLTVYKTIDSYCVVNAQKIKDMVYDYIIVMSAKSYGEIVDYALKLGVNRCQLISYRVLEVPGFSFEKHRKLNEQRLSIISNNCWGGIIYNTLGMECLSPFKNLFLEDNEYLRLIHDFDRYMDLDPVYSRNAVDPHSGKIYPVLALDDIELHCNHDDNSESAILNWNRRRKKININNLLFEMYTIDEGTAEIFVSLKTAFRKVCFVPFKTNNKEMIHLRMSYGKDLNNFWETVIDSARGKTVCEYSLYDLLLDDYYKRAS